jgi:hypothetical protein
VTLDRIPVDHKQGGEDAEETAETRPHPED